MTIEIVGTMRNRIIVEAKTDIINHPYIKVLNVWELEERGGRKKRRTRIVNVYGNHLQPDQG